MANTGRVIYQNLEEYNVATGQATGVTKPNDLGDPDYVAPVDDSEEPSISCPLGVIDTYSYSVEGGTVSVSNACTLADLGNFGTTLWSTSNTLTTGIFLYNTQNGAETQSSGDYAMNGFYAAMISGSKVSIQINSGEVLSIDFC